jgi:hypothetical protein
VRRRTRAELEQIEGDLGTLGPTVLAGNLDDAKTYFDLMQREASISHLVVRCKISPELRGVRSPFPELNQAFNNASSDVDNNRGLGHVGGGLEYRFTPHIAIFGEATYNWVGGGQHNFNSSVKDFTD